MLHNHPEFPFFFTRNFDYEISLQTRTGARRCANGILSLFVSGRGVFRGPFDRLHPLIGTETAKLELRPYSRTPLSSPSPASPNAPFLIHYPADDGSAATFTSVPPNSRRVR